MTDIVEALRKYQCPENKGCNAVVEYCQCALMGDGADEIERLRDAIDRMLDSGCNTEAYIIGTEALQQKESE